MTSLYRLPCGRREGPGARTPGFSPHSGRRVGLGGRCLDTGVSGRSGGRFWGAEAPVTSVPDPRPWARWRHELAPPLRDLQAPHQRDPHHGLRPAALRPQRHLRLRPLPLRHQPALRPHELPQHHRAAVLPGAELLLGAAGGALQHGGQGQRPQDLCPHLAGDQLCCLLRPLLPRVPDPRVPAGGLLSPEPPESARPLP